MRHLLTASFLAILGIVLVTSYRTTETIASDTSMSESKSAISRSVRSRSARSVPAPARVFVPPEKIPVLVYHHIRVTKPYPKSTWSYKMSVSPDVFRKQMEWIRDKGYTTVTLDEFVAIRSGQMESPVKPIVLTFDDNQRTQYEIAYPILREMNMKGVFYLITNRLKNTAFIVEDEVRQMAEAGMDIQSHSVSHPILTNLSTARLTVELSESRKALEALLGRPVRHIAYPLTAHNQRIRDAAKSAGYTTGTIMDPRQALRTDDPYKIPRIMMTDDTNLAKVLP